MSEFLVPGLQDTSNVRGYPGRQPQDELTEADRERLQVLDYLTAREWFTLLGPANAGQVAALTRRCLAYCHRHRHLFFEFINQGRLHRYFHRSVLVEQHQAASGPRCNLPPL